MMKTIEAQKKELMKQKGSGRAKRGGQSKNHMDGKTQEETHSQNTAGNDINGKESLSNGGFVWRIRIGKLPHYFKHLLHCRDCSHQVYES